ncbi:MAG TPA: hypothetical protein DDZ81_23410 [Acetobacteraceae bacterium]|nr:hypothetical protein [Acetobacteraceae bacterium]
MNTAWPVAVCATILYTNVAQGAQPDAQPLLMTSPANWQLAQTTPSGAAIQSDPPAASDAPVSSVSQYFSGWFDRVERAQASQPHWMTPLVTVTPRLEQEVRYDQYWQNRANGSTLDTFGSGKGLELIPTETNEILINPPAYQELGAVKKPVSGWADDPFLVVKQRLLSANEQDGNYIVTTFLGVTAPSGNVAFTNRAWYITPTIAFGKGWENFDIQATIGVPTPLSYQSRLGTSIATNVAFQYHAFAYFWPEFEVNHTYWMNGIQRAGKNQVFLTPGLILGRFQIKDRIKAVIGVGYQFAVSPKFTDVPVMTPVYDRAWVMTARLTF